MDKYKILLEILNKLREMDLPNKAEIYDNIIEVENFKNMEEDREILYGGSLISPKIQDCPLWRILI